MVACIRLRQSTTKFASNRRKIVGKSLLSLENVVQLKLDFWGDRVLQCSCVGATTCRVGGLSVAKVFEKISFEVEGRPHRFGFCHHHALPVPVELLVRV